MWWFYDPCFCTHSKAEIMRIILGFYRTKNALEKVKLWPFEKLPQILVLLPHFFLSPIFCISFGTHPPYVRKKNQPNRVLVYSLSLVTRHGLTDFFSHFGRVCYKEEKCGLDLKSFNLSYNKIHHLEALHIGWRNSLYLLTFFSWLLSQSRPS